MKEYLLSVIGIVLFSTVLLAIVPEGKTSSAIKGVAKTACLLSIAAPVIQYFCAFTSGAKNVEAIKIFFEETVIDEDETFIQYYSEMRIRIAENALQNELEELYQIDAEVKISWQWQEEEAFYTDRAVKILSITLQPENVIEEGTLKVVCEYLKNKYCSEVLIE